MRVRLKIVSTDRRPPDWTPRGHAQAKCEHCLLRFVWPGKPNVGDADCPVCSRELLRTTVGGHLKTIECRGKKVRQLSVERKRALAEQLERVRRGPTQREMDDYSRDMEEQLQEDVT